MADPIKAESLADEKAIDFTSQTLDRLTVFQDVLDADLSARVLTAEIRRYFDYSAEEWKRL